MFIEQEVTEDFEMSEYTKQFMYVYVHICVFFFFFFENLKMHTCSFL